MSIEMRAETCLSDEKVSRRAVRQGLGQDSPEGDVERTRGVRRFLLEAQAPVSGCLVLKSAMGRSGFAHVRFMHKRYWSKHLDARTKPQF